MWLIRLAFVAALCFYSVAQQHLNIQNPTTAFDIIEELRILRNSEEERRKRIAKHDTELATLKSELDPVRRYCDCWSTDNDELPGLKRAGDPHMPQLSENRIQKGRAF